MNGRALANEFAKMSHLHTRAVAAAMAIAGIVLALFTIVSIPGMSLDTTGAWDALLAGLSLGIPLVCPLLLAVMASRLVDIEHQSNGWLLQATSGISPGGMCRAKLLALGLVVASSTVLTGAVTVVLGRLLVGITAPVPLGRFATFIGCMVVVNIVVLALHILIAAKIENQLVGLGIGAFGSVAAVFSQGLPAAAAHFTPWGYYALAKAADYQTNGFVPRPIHVASIAALGVISATAFAILTQRFDRQEA